MLAWRLGDSMKRLEWRREKQAQKNWWNRLPSPHSGKMRDRRLPGGGSQNRAPQPVLSRRPPPGASRRRKRDASHTTAPGGRSTLRESPAISTVPWHAGGTGVQFRNAPQGRGPPRSKTGLPPRAPQHAGRQRGCRHPRPPQPRPRAARPRPLLLATVPGSWRALLSAAPHESLAQTSRPARTLRAPPRLRGDTRNAMCRRRPGARRRAQRATSSRALLPPVPCPACHPL